MQMSNFNIRGCGTLDPCGERAFSVSVASRPLACVLRLLRGDPSSTVLSSGGASTAWRACKISGVDPCTVAIRAVQSSAEVLPVALAVQVARFPVWNLVECRCTHHATVIQLRILDGRFQYH